MSDGGYKAPVAKDGYGTPERPVPYSPWQRIVDVHWGGAVALVKIHMGDILKWNLQRHGETILVPRNENTDPTYTDGITVWEPPLSSDDRPAGPIEKTQYLASETPPPPRSGTGIYFVIRTKSYDDGHVRTIIGQQNAWFDYAAGDLAGPAPLSQFPAFADFLEGEAFWTTHGPSDLDPPLQAENFGIRHMNEDITEGSGETYRWVSQFFAEYLAPFTVGRVTDVYFLCNMSMVNETVNVFQREEDVPTTFEYFVIHDWPGAPFHPEPLPPRSSNFSLFDLSGQFFGAGSQMVTETTGEYIDSDKAAKIKIKMYPTNTRFAVFDDDGSGFETVKAIHDPDEPGEDIPKPTWESEEIELLDFGIAVKFDIKGIVP